MRKLSKPSWKWSVNIWHPHLVQPMFKDCSLMGGWWQLITDLPYQEKSWTKFSFCEKMRWWRTSILAGYKKHSFVFQCTTKTINVINKRKVNLCVCVFRHARVSSTYPCCLFVGDTFGFPACQRLWSPYVKSWRERTPIIFVYFPKVYFLKVYFPKVYFSKVYFRFLSILCNPLCYFHLWWSSFWLHLCALVIYYKKWKRQKYIWLWHDHLSIWPWFQVEVTGVGWFSVIAFMSSFVLGSIMVTVIFHAEVGW